MILLVDYLKPQEGEQEKDYLLRLGSLKEQGQIKITWDDLALLLNAAFRADTHYETESCWRKRYKRMAHTNEKPVIGEEIHIMDSIIERDESARQRREARAETREADLIEKLLDATKKAEPVKLIPRTNYIKNTAVIAMLSDIHYGMTFSGIGGSYNTKIAAQRVMDYANSIVDIGIGGGAKECYVLLMGDLISGMIKNTIRAENRENIVEQIVGVSELITAFILYISRYFDNVYVYSVNGNHSRVDLNADAGLRGERLDSLVPWYCKGRLSLVENVKFDLDALDSTVAAFDVYGKQYVCVHGDLDPNLRTSVQRLEPIIGRHIDYLLAGHLHVPYMNLENTGFIRNGCVCGSGDDYTVKKRLFSPASQVALIVDEDGVESIHPVVFK